MTKYYIFRHGQTRYSKYHLPYPKNNRLVSILTDSVLSLEKIAKYLRNVPSDLNVSSEYLRCRQTTKIITKITNMKFKKEAKLNEFSQETFSEFSKRIKKFLEDVDKKKYQTVIVCTHGAVIAGIKNYLVKNEFRRRDLIDYPGPGVLTIVENGKIEEINFN